MDIIKEMDQFDEFNPDEVKDLFSDASLFEFYTGALEKVIQGSSDMAAILLRKVVASEDYVPAAHVLLAMCLIDNREHDEALDVLRAALDKNPKEELVLHYMDRYFSGTRYKKSREKTQSEKKDKPVLPPPPVAKKKRKYQKTPTEPKPNRAEEQEKKKEKKKPSKKIFAGLSSRSKENSTKKPKRKIRKVEDLIALWPMAVVVLLLLVAGVWIGYTIGHTPAEQPNEQEDERIAEYRSLLEDANTKEQRLQEDIEELRQENLELSRQSGEYQKRVEQLEQKILDRENTFLLLSIEELVANENMDLALQRLKEIDPTALDTSQMLLFDSLRSEVYRTLIGEWYDRGMVLYNQSNWEDSYDRFSAIIALEYPEYEQMGDVYYRAARCIYQMGEYEESIAYFETVIESFPEYEHMDYTLYYLGRAHQYIGQFEKAKQHYETLSDEYPQSFLMPHVRDRLNEIAAILDR